MTTSSWIKLIWSLTSNHQIIHIYLCCWSSNGCCCVSLHGKRCHIVIFSPCCCTFTSNVCLASGNCSYEWKWCLMCEEAQPEPRTLTRMLLQLHFVLLRWDSSNNKRFNTSLVFFQENEIIILKSANCSRCPVTLFDNEIFVHCLLNVHLTWSDCGKCAHCNKVSFVSQRLCACVASRCQQSAWKH